MLNMENLNRLIAHLEAIPDSSFGMLNYADERIALNECGAPACIAGWAIAPRDGFYDPRENTETLVSDDVADWLGLPDDDDAKWQLFGPDGYKEAPERFTRRRVLRTSTISATPIFARARSSSIGDRSRARSRASPPKLWKGEMACHVY